MPCAFLSLSRGQGRGLSHCGLSTAGKLLKSLTSLRMPPESPHCLGAQQVACPVGRRLVHTAGRQNVRPYVRRPARPDGSTYIPIADAMRCPLRQSLLPPQRLPLRLRLSPSLALPSVACFSLHRTHVRTSRHALDFVVPAPCAAFTLITIAQRP